MRGLVNVYDMQHIFLRLGLQCVCFVKEHAVRLLRPSFRNKAPLASSIFYCITKINSIGFRMQIVQIISGIASVISVISLISVILISSSVSMLPPLSSTSGCKHDSDNYGQKRVSYLTTAPQEHSLLAIATVLNASAILVRGYNKLYVSHTSVRLDTIHKEGSPSSVDRKFDKIQIAQYHRSSHGILCDIDHVNIDTTLAFRFRGDCTMDESLNAVVVQLYSDEHPRLASHKLDEYIEYLQSTDGTYGNSLPNRRSLSWEGYDGDESFRDAVNVCCANRGIALFNAAPCVLAGQLYVYEGETGLANCSHVEFTVEPTSYVECPNQWDSHMDGDRCTCTNGWYDQIYYTNSPGVYATILWLGASGSAVD